MAKAIQVPYQYNVDVPIETAQAVQKNRKSTISLEALGLLVNLLSYPTKWELHKTELYKRFAKHGEKSVRTAWNDLVENNYIIEFKYRIGRKYEYVYYYRKVPFTQEEKAEILDNAFKEYGEIWGLQNGDSKMETAKGRDNQNNILNKNNILNIKDNIDDDDKRTSSLNKNDINLIISNLREATKEDLTDRSFNSVVRKVMDKYNQGKIISLRDYLSTALIKKMEELELRRTLDEEKRKILEQTKETRENRIRNMEISNEVVFYNWLEG